MTEMICNTMAAIIVEQSLDGNATVLCAGIKDVEMELQWEMRNAMMGTKLIMIVVLMIVNLDVEMELSKWEKVVMMEIGITQMGVTLNAKQRKDIIVNNQVRNAFLFVGMG